MKKLLLIIIISFLTNAVGAQNIVYLKNGSIIHGSIIEQTPDSITKIQTKDGNVFVYKNSEIEKITKETIQDNSTQAIHHIIIDTAKYSGFVLCTQLYPALYIGNTNGAPHSSSELSNSTMGWQIIFGYQHKKIYSIGLGWGVIGLESGSLPVFIDGRINLNHKFDKTYFEFEIGNLFGVSNGNLPSGFGNTFINPELGITLPVSPKNTMDLGIGLLFQRLPFYISNYEYANGYSFVTNVTIDYSLYTFLQVNVGFTFL